METSNRYRIDITTISGGVLLMADKIFPLRGLCAVLRNLIKVQGKRNQRSMAKEIVHCVVRCYKQDGLLMDEPSGAVVPLIDSSVAQKVVSTKAD